MWVLAAAWVVGAGLLSSGCQNTPGVGSDTDSGTPSGTGVVTFADTWETGLTGNGNWKAIQTVASDRFQMVTSPVRHGAHAARVAVRPGDDPIRSSGERSEVLIMTDSSGNSINEGESSGTQYYAFSVRFDSDWQSPAPDTGNGGTWGLIFQLHGPDSLGASPSFGLDATSKLSLNVHAGDISDSANPFRWKKYAFTGNDDLSRGTWIDLVVMIKFAKDATGAVAIWRRDQDQSAFTQVLAVSGIPTLQYSGSGSAVGPHYWKHGYYRGKQPDGGVTNVLWLDDLARGTSFDAVVQAAFGG
jgi:hypothetical protein